jgi:hypothetical protein
MKEVRKVNTKIKGVGPEIAGASGAATSYLMCECAPLVALLHTYSTHYRILGRNTSAATR